MGESSLDLTEGMEISLEEIDKRGWKEKGSFAYKHIIFGKDIKRCLYNMETGKIGIIFDSVHEGFKN